jgi:ribosomal-protein-alanine N-acetyltransferase
MHAPQSPPPPRIAIRRGREADVPWLRRLSGEAFAPFGRYDDLIPAWAAAAGTALIVAEADGDPIGFALVGFFREQGASGRAYADLLAIAVEEEWRGRGMGRTLLREAVAAAESRARFTPLRELRLSVAQDNAAARRLFESEGFSLLEDGHGTYDGGQAALRMSRPLSPRHTS